MTDQLIFAETDCIKFSIAEIDLLVQQSLS